MRRLIVCCDGTWNNPEQESNGVPAATNVFKIYNAIEQSTSNAAVKQLGYYHPGVGGEGGFVRPVVGGAVGAGIGRHIRSAYHWLGCNYEEGDEIYLYGFSRGAFTVRSLCGFLGHGLLDLRGIASKESWRRVEKTYSDGYKNKRERGDWVEQDWGFFHQGEPAPVRFIGVWDTVGALGVPDDLEVLNVFDNADKWRFHDTQLGDHVTTARHAMATDELRSSFTVCRWQNADRHPDAIEMWFPGVHSDVGGGYANCDLANGALLWMMEESGKVGLRFRAGATETLEPKPLGVMHNSYQGAFAKLRSRPRNLDAMLPANEDRFHPGALQRQRVSPLGYPAYHPTRVLEVGETHTVDVFAGTRWNYSGLYLPKGHSFVFLAIGEWQDGKDSCDWQGTEDDNRTVGDIVRGAASFLGRMEVAFQRLSGNQATDFLGTKRVEHLKWFTMVGAVTNDAGTERAVSNDGSPVEHQYVALPSHERDPLKIDHPGYLYCFANDVWSLYDNNRGSVSLTVKRVG